VSQDLLLAESKAALAREATARRKLHNLVQELRGNIRVFVRVKPANAKAKGTPVLACEDGQRIACTAAGATKACYLCPLKLIIGPALLQDPSWPVDVIHYVLAAQARPLGQWCL